MRTQPVTPLHAQDLVLDCQTMHEQDTRTGQPAIGKITPPGPNSTILLERTIGRILPDEVVRHSAQYMFNPLVEIAEGRHQFKMHLRHLR